MTLHQQPPTTPPVVIHNNLSSSAAASAVVGSYGYPRRRRQSLWVHFWLLMFTAGIGNVFYAVHVSRWNRDHGL